MKSEMIGGLRACEIMSREPVVAREDDTIGAVMKTLMQRKITGVPVVSAAGVLCGIVTERDLLLQHSLVTWVSDVMTREVFTAEPETGIDDLARILLENSIKRVVIVQDGRPVGIVSRRDILRARLP